MLVCVVCVASSKVFAQASSTASRAGDLQVGASVNFALGDYPDLSSNNFFGYGFYATFDFKPHWGIDGAYHQVSETGGNEGVYERSFEIGPRYVRHHGDRWDGYLKATVGRGILNFPKLPSDPNGQPAANLAYNIVAGGVGIDYSFRPSINFRAEYEVQYWLNFPVTLTPQVFTIGAAYHFH
jgi:hypothetical protein